MLKRGICSSLLCMDKFAAFRDTNKFELVTEGLVTTVNEKIQDKKVKAAFYNPAQVINRDLSLAFIQW